VNPQRLRIATRESKLAMWQTEHVAARLGEAHPGLAIEIVGMTTKGDRILDRPLAQVGGKGLFIKELEVALADDLADIAVHSMKDVPMTLAPEFALVAIAEREVPLDAFVSNKYESLDDMPPGAVVGTSSLRREAQVRARYPHLVVKPLRGNVGTRLKKLDEGQFDAILLAAAGLKRLGLEARITQALAPEFSLPAIGQGAIGVECRLDDASTRERVAALDDSPTRTRIAAERAFNARLQGGCQVPIAGYAILEGDRLWLRGLVGEPDGSRIVAGEIRGPATSAAALGATLADELLGRGAAAILRRVLAIA